MCNPCMKGGLPGEAEAVMGGVGQGKGKTR